MNKNRLSLQFVLGLLCFLVVEAETVASPIEYIDDERSVWLNRRTYTDGYHRWLTEDSIPYNETPNIPLISWTNRTFISTLGTNSFSARMSALNTESGDEDILTFMVDMPCAKFDMTFRLHEAKEISLSGSAIGKIPYYLGSFDLYAVGDAQPIFSPVIDQSESVDISYNAVLEAGDYRLLAQLKDIYEERYKRQYSISFNADFAVIPEPSSVLLLLAGAGGLLAYCRSQRKGRHHIPTRRDFSDRF